MLKCIVKVALTGLFFCIIFEPLSASPQNMSLFRFAAVTPINQIEFVDQTTEMNEVVIIEPMKEMEEQFAQCLYDFQGNRINKGCALKERPPMCSRGVLVQTLVGNEHEMCCCNYSNLSTW